MIDKDCFLNSNIECSRCQACEECELEENCFYDYGDEGCLMEDFYWKEMSYYRYNRGLLEWTNENINI